MMLDITFWKALAAVVGVLCSIAGAVWGFARIIVSQFNANLEARFDSLNELRTQSNDAIEKRLDGLRKNLDEKHAENRHQWDDKFKHIDLLARENERSLLKLRADLPNDYVRREDWIRFSGTIDSKLDNLRAMLDSVREKINARS